MRRIDVNELEVEVLVSLSIGLGAQVVYQNTRLTTPQWDTLLKVGPLSYDLFSLSESSNRRRIASCVRSDS